MKKRFFPTIVALVVFLVLFWYANLFESSEIPEPGKDLPVDLAKVNAVEVKKLTWKTPGSPDVVVESNSDGAVQKFQLVQPLKLRGEAGELNGVLRSFEDLKSERTILTTATDTTMYGIGSTSPTLAIETASQTVLFTLGDRNPVGGHYLTRSGDPALYLVTSPVDMAFRKTVYDLRSRSLFFEDFTNVASLAIDTPSGTMKLERNASGAWQIREPKAVAADDAEVMSLINGIQGLRANRFAQDNTPETDFAKYQLNKPVSRARLFDRSGRVFELKVGRDEGGEVFVMRSDDSTVYVLQKTALGILERDFDRLRTKELVSVPREGVESVTVAAATSTAEVNRVEKEWKTKDRVVNPSFVNGLIDAVNSARVISFHPWEERESHGLGRPDGCDRITLKHPGATIELLLGKADGANLYAYLEGRKEVFRLPGGLRQAVMDLLVEADRKPAPAAASGTVATPGNPLGATNPVDSPVPPLTGNGPVNASAAVPVAPVPGAGK